MRQVSLWDVDDVESFGPVSGIFGGLTPQRPCYECGKPRGWYPVGDHWLCPPCRQQVLDVVELAASLNMSIFDLAAAVVK